MTWVVATAGPIFGAMVADVRVSRQAHDGSWSPFSSVGLRKVHPFSDRTLCGFAVELERASSALVSVNEYMRETGRDEPPLIDHLKQWVNDLYRRLDPLTKVADLRAQLVLVRTVLSVVSPDLQITAAVGGRVSFPHQADAAIRVRRFGWVEHIGSGVGVPAYRAAIEEMRRDPVGLANMEMAMPGEGLPARVLAFSLSRVIERSPEAAVSPDVQVCVVTGHGRDCWSFRQPSLHVCETVDEFRDHAAEERQGDRGAVIV